MAMTVTALILTIYFLGFTYGAPSKEKDLKEELQVTTHEQNFKLL